MPALLSFPGRKEAGFDGGQFGLGFVVGVGEFAGVTIPVAAVAQVAFDFVDDGVNPGGGGIVVVLLDDAMRGIPLAGKGEFDGLEEFGVGSGHSEIQSPVCWSQEQLVGTLFDSLVGDSIIED